MISWTRPVIWIWTSRLVWPVAMTMMTMSMIDCRWLRMRSSVSWKSRVWNAWRISPTGFERFDWMPERRAARNGWRAPEQMEHHRRPFRCPKRNDLRHSDYRRTLFLRWSNFVHSLIPCSVRCRNWCHVESKERSDNREEKVLYCCSRSTMGLELD